MQDILIYGGIGINIIGALYLMAYAMKYGHAFYKARKRPIETDSLKAAWGKKRAIGFGLIIAGTLIAIIGCSI
ncbi:MAG: hypothetical protein HDS26_04885 [Bacteroides sp.]|nr:hypothetical protein [Bacteroides sp.]